MVESKIPEKKEMTVAVVEESKETAVEINEEDQMKKEFTQFMVEMKKLSREDNHYT